MAQGKRFKFQGSSLSVQTGLETGTAITAITRANPGVVSSTGHGNDDGDVVKLTTTGMTELDGNLVVVDNVTTNTFELVGYDTTDYEAFAVDSPNTAKAQTVVFSTFCELTSVSQEGGSATQTDVTTICSTTKEFELGLSDSGTLRLDFNYAGAEDVQSALRAANITKTPLAFRISLPNNGGTILMIGFVLTTSLSGAVDGVWKATASVKLTGDIVVL
jgi:hypothetical protein